MTNSPQSASWNKARNAMQRLELSANRISRGWFAGAAALGVAALLLVVLGVVLDVNLNRLRDSLAWVQHSNDILLQVSGIEQSFVQVESSARAYALTSDRSYVGTLKAADRDVEKRLAAVRDLVADNPAQTHEIEILRPLFRARLTWLATFARLDPVSARALAVSRQKPATDLRREQRRLTARLAAGLAVFRDRETGLRASRQVAAQNDTELLSVFAVVAALLAASSGAYGGYLLIRESRDTRSRALQMELTHTQRLGLMGQNSATLAHEINQPLTAATNYLGVLSRLLTVPGEIDRDKLREVVQRVGEQVNRVGGVVARLRDFVSKRDGERSIESPETLVADAVALFNTFGDKGKLETRVDAGLPDVLADRIQVQQVLVNLLRNAMEATQDSAHQELRLTVARGKTGAVVFSLWDRGPGLTKEVAAHLFEPFVSTKQNGMGVGLSICRKILHDHGGRIWAEARDGGGAVFCFELPALPAIRTDLAA